MTNRTKLTPFARLALFLIIFLPLAYFGAAYINGEDPVAKVKDMVNGTETAAKTERSSSPKDTYDPQQEIKQLKQENKKLKDRVKALEAELQDKKKSAGTSEKWGQ